MERNSRQDKIGALCPNVLVEAGAEKWAGRLSVVGGLTVRLDQVGSGWPGGAETKQGLDRP